MNHHLSVYIYDVIKLYIYIYKMFFFEVEIVSALFDQKLKHVVYKDDVVLFLLPIQKMLQMFLPIT